MQTHLAAARAELVQLDTARVVAPVLLGNVVALFALRTLQRNVSANGFLCHFSKPSVVASCQLPALLLTTDN
jgi:hypothetical protein